MLDCGLPPVFTSTKRNRRLVLLIGDVVLVTVAFLLAPFLLPGSDFPLTLQVDPVSSLGSLAIPVLCMIGFLEFARLRSGYSGVERTQQISLSVGGVFLLEAFLSYVGFAWLPGLWEICVACVLCAVL